MTAPPPSPPRTVRAAVGLLLLVTVLGVVVAAITSTDTARLRQLVAQRSPQLDPDAVNLAVHIGVASAIGGAIVNIGLNVWLGWKTYRGRNWARIVLWVLLGLGILSGIIVVARPDLTFSRALSIVGFVIDIAIVVLLAMPDSNRFFARPPPPPYPQYPPQGQPPYNPPPMWQPPDQPRG